MRGGAILAATVAALSLAACGSSPSDQTAPPGAARTTATSVQERGQAPRLQRRRRFRRVRPAHRPAPAHPGPSRTAYIRRADRACRASHIRVAQLSAQLARLLTNARAGRVTPSEYYARAATFTDAMGREGEQAVRDLRALPHPARDARLTAFLDTAAGESRLVRAQAQALRHRDAASLRSLVAQTLRLGRRSHRLARAYGFRSCGGASAKTLR